MHINFQNVDKINDQKGGFCCSSVLYRPGTGLYTNSTCSSSNISFYATHIVKTTASCFELLHNLILDRSRILCNVIYVLYLVYIYTYLFSYLTFIQYILFITKNLLFFECVI